MTDATSQRLATSKGPWFEELSRGQVFDAAPGMTLTSGHAATHQAVVGDRLRLALDEELAREVVGAAPLAHPALVWDLAIGQSTLATHHVKANLFYRGLALHRLPVLGDTLRTSTEVVALRRNRPRPGRHPTGLAVLRVRTVDQAGRLVLDFHRCAMLPLSDPDAATGQHDDLDRVGSQLTDDALARVARGWDLARFRKLPGRHLDGLAHQRGWIVGGGDVVSNAPELARLTLNIAMVHHDRTAAGGRRLVYGGHTIGLALSQITRALPNLVTVAGWQGCDHTGPVFEGDTVSTRVMVDRTDPLPGGGGLVHLRARVDAHGEPGEDRREVLDWRLVAVMA